MLNNLINKLDINELLGAIARTQADKKQYIITDISVVSNSDLLLIRYADINNDEIYEATVMHVDNINLSVKYVIYTATRLK